MKGSLCGGKGICAYYDQMAVMTKWAVANAPGFQTVGVAGWRCHPQYAAPS